MLDAKEKYGYVLKDNEIQPVNELAYHKFSTGMFDDVSKANTKSYLEGGVEMLEICEETEDHQKLANLIFENYKIGQADILDFFIFNSFTDCPYGRNMCLRISLGPFVRFFTSIGLKKPPDCSEVSEHT